MAQRASVSETMTFPILILQTDVSSLSLLSVSSVPSAMRSADARHPSNIIIHPFHPFTLVCVKGALGCSHARLWPFILSGMYLLGAPKKAGMPQLPSRAAPGGSIGDFS